MRLGERDLGIGRTYGKHKRIEEHRTRVERFGEAPEAEVRRLEVIRREGEPKQRNETVCGHGGDGARADEAGKCDLAGENRAEERCREDKDHRNSV